MHLVAPFSWCVTDQLFSTYGIGLNVCEVIFCRRLFHQPRLEKLQHKSFVNKYNWRLKTNMQYFLQTTYIVYCSFKNNFHRNNPKAPTKCSRNYNSEELSSLDFYPSFKGSIRGPRLRTKVLLNIFFVHGLLRMVLFF